jgi:hypothetical protein
VVEGRVKERERRSKGRHRPAHTNSGKFMYLQADYRAGRLSAAGEEQYERIVYLMGLLWKEQVRS